ncbi:MAG: hypothetical protein PHU80_10015, partial [Kiritimatiellae bacterium]|nr:hypothetical protein [Kiritimatiellia bacterium]
TGNRYHAAWVQVGEKRYMPEDREKYAETTGDKSAWLKTDEPWTEAGCGADPTHMVKNDPVMRERFKAASAAYDAQAAQVCEETNGMAILLDQNFNDQALFPCELRGRVGSRIRPSGRWHSFAEKGPLIARDATGGALRLVRGGITAVAETLLNARSTQPYVFKCRLYREPGGGASLTLRDALALDDAAVLVDGEGRISLRNFQGPSAWHALDVTLPEGKWAQLAVRVAASSATVMVDGNQVGAALPRNGAGLVPASLIFAPQGTEGAAVMIDDVSIGGE